MTYIVFGIIVGMILGFVCDAMGFNIFEWLRNKHNDRT